MESKLQTKITADEAYKPSDSLVKDDSTWTSQDSVPIQTTPTLLVVTFTFVTFGFYIPYWYFSRRKHLNALGSYDKLGMVPIIFLFILLIGSTVLQFLAPTGVDQVAALFSGNQADVVFVMANRILVLVIGITAITLSFKVRKIVSDHFGLRDNSDYALSAIATFILQHYYLQYKINQLFKIERASQSTL